MKILKQGKLPSEEEYTTTCRHCKTEFEFKRGEAKYESDPRDGGFLRIACPLCGTDAIIYPRR